MKKRLICLFLSALIMVSISSMFTVEASTDTRQYIKVTGYDPSVDYTVLINKCIADGSQFAVQQGWIYEQQRNLKIDGLGWQKKYTKTYYFKDAKTMADVKKNIEAAKKPKYTDEDLLWLSRCVNAEMGCSWMPDWVQRATASVVVNNAKMLNKSIEQTIKTPYKYGCYWNGSIWATPSQQVIRNCKYVLENGVTVPEDVIGQSSYSDVYGPIYQTYYDPYLGTTTYFWRAR